MDFSIIKKLSFYGVVTLLFFSQNSIAQELIVFDNIPGRASSDHYQCRVKFTNEDDSKWRDAFVLQTRAKEQQEDPENAYYDLVRGWTASWISFESDFNGDNVIVEISKKDGSPITKAMVRPVGEASPAVIENGKAYVTFSESANINVDINGQLEDNYTGFDYKGPKVHTISLFANPIFQKPDVNNSTVKVLQPNENINSLDRSTWKTIIFAPGIHEIGLSFQILSDETYYIHGDAIVKGTMHPQNKWGNQASLNFKVYGSGTLSSEDIIRHPDDDENRSVKPFTYQAEGAHLEGFVMVDPAFHTLNMGHSGGDLTNINIYKNLKILAWRKNSDGVNAFRSSEVFDCFFRVQDDAFYLGASNVNQHDNTVWNDANGAVLFLPRALDGSTCTFENVKVIYHRAFWHWWDGGRIVSMRELQPGTTISNVHIKNILVEDPLPAFPPFYGVIESGSNENVTFNNIIIENVRQEHDGVASSLDANRGKPKNTLKGLDENRKFKNILFKDCYFNGKTLTSFEDGNFLTEFVDANTVIFSEGSLQDDLINITAPDKVSPNETVNVSVEYSATEQRDLRVYIQLNSSPWTGYGSVKVTVEAGQRTEIIPLIINSNIPIANDAYKIVANLLPVGKGWSDRLDEITEPNVDAVQNSLSTFEATFNKISIYPNPVEDQITIKSEQLLNKVTLFDLTGKQLYTKNLQSKTHQVDVSIYAKGTYFLEITNSSGKSINKLIIQ